MGWIYETADWSLAKEALFPGGIEASMFWTILAIVACVVVLWVGNRSEHARYDDR